MYVEGEEDKIFWDHFYSHLGFSYTVKFKPAGGCEEIKKISSILLHEDANIVIIRDKDYLTFFPDPTSHVREIYTVGHSVENTVYSPDNIAKCIKVMSGCESLPKQETIEWLYNLETSIKRLQILEIAAVLQNTSRTCDRTDGIEVLGDNPFNIIDAKPNEHMISEDRVNAKISSISSQFSSDSMQEAKIIYNRSRGKRYRRIRGHFMTGMVYNYIMRSIELISSDTQKHKFHMGILYKILVGFSDLSTIEGDEIRYFRRRMREAFASLGLVT
ncbi:DUF4435 domain-containing protein (plasmid) [Deinococcus sp. KNUC1210]|uniref:DUF4435 domain-containing protein n=1 Tax=Deinococcus sp. KNUC1210 TaxID=2917691 RepID=UPI001EEFCA4F|nr:DUF4435 domain-containing protein [Deinococcus sp. KNUC1210]ULH17448.1 DUF4435 domain-containing protein [Deinococcus sp. KNUC1210]